jgi:homoserine kinase type II
LGYKTEAYDAANLVGCIGMEQPQGITADLVYEFIQHLKQSAYLSDDSWQHFFELVLALRFAWLSEWLHRNDPDMVELEIVYIGMLLESRELLLRSWGLPC